MSSRPDEEDGDHTLVSDSKPSEGAHGDPTGDHKLLLESRKLQKATEALLEMQGFEDVLRIVCSAAEDLTGASGSGIFLLEKGAAPLRNFRHGQAFPGGDQRLETEHNPGQSYLKLPLSVRGHTLGTLVLIRHQGGFEEEAVGLARHFADQAALAIQHALFHLQHEQLLLMEERQKLAHELHDSVTQSIYGVTMFGEAASRLLAANQLDRANAILKDLQRTAFDALREMRLLVFELRPPTLDKDGLAAALQARLAAVEGRAGLATELSISGSEALPPLVTEALYGIAKEALNNVLKHAEATRVAIGLRHSAEHATLEITDNGGGFDPASVGERGGLGLQGMRERAAGIGGRLKLTSHIGRGTTVRVQVPLGLP